MSGTPPPKYIGGRPVVGEPLLDRAFRILESFSDAGDSALSLHVLAGRADLPKSTALRIAMQLVKLGALERDEYGGFVIGLRLLEFASLAPRGHGLRAAALPYMEDLHRVTRQHVLLGVRDGGEAVLVERLSARDATAVKYRVGGRLPLETTGIGIALLAHSSESVRMALITSLEEAGGAGIDLRKLIAVVRSEGVCVVTGPNPAGSDPALISTVASPILGPRGALLGAISLVAPGAEGATAANQVAIRTASLAIARAMLSQR